MKIINNLDKKLISLIKDKFPHKFDELAHYILPLNKSEKYSEVSAASVKEVEKDPEIFIMPECIPACKELWSKNIYTFMSSDYVDGGICWIEIHSELSDENFKILQSLKSDEIFLDVYHNGCYRFGINCSGIYAQEKLLDICKKFKMQDVPKDIAYLDEKTFLIKCGCCDEILNPNYYEMKEFYELEFNSLDEVYLYIKKYNEWNHSENSKKYIKLYNEDKKTKSTSEYAKENNMIYENNRIYLSEYDYNKHIAYLQYKEKNELMYYYTHMENGVESVENESEYLKM
jgi:hypothetical protein